jgi:hypothetical protein
MSGNARAFADNAGVIGLLAFWFGSALIPPAFDGAELLRRGDTRPPGFSWDIGCHVWDDPRLTIVTHAR